MKKAFLPSIVVVLALAAPARADDVEEARMYFDAGQQAYAAGDYQTAIRSLEQAYKASPRPQVAFSLAQAYRKQYVIDGDAGKLKQAVTLYRKYLDDVGQGGRREDAVNYLAELQPQLLRIEAERPVSAPGAPPSATQLMVMSRQKGARASIDGEPAAEVPLTRDVAPGRHHIRVDADGHFPEEIDGLAVAGRLVVVESTPREMPATLVLTDAAGDDVALDGRAISVGERGISAPAGPHTLSISRRGHRPLARQVVLERGVTTTVQARLEPTTQRLVAYGVLGSAAAALAAASITTVLALDAEARAQDLLARRRAIGLTAGELEEYGDARARRNDYGTASALLFGGAAAAALTGALLYLLDSPSAPAISAESAPVVPKITPDGVGVTLQTRF